MPPDAPTPAPLPGFRRLNFFKGLVTYFTDWADNEAYRRDKLRWHSQHCHGPGVVAGYAGELLVTGRGDLSIEVQPGCAIDGEGRELVLWETQIKHVRLDSLKLPQTVYIVARYVEEGTDFISYKNNLAVRGHRRILEGCAIDVTALAPNVRDEVEIARVLIDKDARQLVDAADAHAPRPNEIDLRYVLRAGRAGSGLDRATQLALTSMLAGTRQSLGLMARTGKIESARDALHAAISLSATHAVDLTDAHNLLTTFESLFWLQVAIYVDIKLHHSTLTQLGQWNEWVGQLRLMQRTLGAGGRTPARDRLVFCVNAQNRINDIVRAMFSSATASNR